MIKDTDNKVGIVCDNYKVSKFKKELTKSNFTFTTKGFNTVTTAIFITGVSREQIKDIAKICTKCEIEFKQSN